MNWKCIILIVVVALIIILIKYRKQIFDFLKEKKKDFERNFWKIVYITLAVSAFITLMIFGWFCADKAFSPRTAELQIVALGNLDPTRVVGLDSYKATYELFNSHFSQLLVILGFLGTMFGVLIPAGAYLLQRQSIKDERERMEKDLKAREDSIIEKATAAANEATAVANEATAVANEATAAANEATAVANEATAAANEATAAANEATAAANEATAAANEATAAANEAKAKADESLRLAEEAKNKLEAEIKDNCYSLADVFDGFAKIGGILSSRNDDKDEFDKLVVIALIGEILYSTKAGDKERSMSAINELNSLKTSFEKFKHKPLSWKKITIIKNCLGDDFFKFKELYNKYFETPLE